MARPTKQTPSLIKKAKEYIDEYESTYGDAIPSVVGLCSAINITRTTAYDWAKDEDSEFSYILDKINEKQHQVLINKGLLGSFNSNITKLVLGKHGYHDKQETELNANLGVSFTDKRGL